MNANPVPRPTSARPRNPSAGSAAGSAAAFPTATRARPTNAVLRAPKRSAARPPGICMAMCTTNCTVVKSPIVASPTPYACERRVATAPSAAMFQPIAMPTPTPPTAARLPIPVPRSTGASVRKTEPAVLGVLPARLEALEHDDGDLPRRLRLVLVVVRPDLVQPAPEPFAFRAFGVAGPCV